MMSENYELLRASNEGIELFENKPKGHVDEPVAAYHAGDGHIHEEILKLIGRVFLIDGPSAPHLVVFSGVDHFTSSSLVCAQVGEALAAQVDGMVCLIEANPLSPILHRYFGVPAGGIPNSAALPKNLKPGRAQSVHGSNLWLVSSAPAAAAGSGSKSPERLKSRLSELAENFSYVLLDAPPVNESADALMLGRIADGIILVLEAHATRRAAALKAKQSLEALRIKILGAVLNQRTYPIPESIYRRL